MFPNATYHVHVDPFAYCYTKPGPSNVQLLGRALIAISTLLKILVPLYPLTILFLVFPNLQRRLLYGHKGYGLFSSRSSDPAFDLPESFGFLPNQVTSHLIPTPDGQLLYSWLIMPLGAYAKDESTLSKTWSPEEAREIALQILRSDTRATIALYLHGSGNNLATQWRCEAYRNLSAGSPDHLYVLSFDYRGFGKSSGSPTEDGLIIDTASVLSWIEKKLGVSRARTLLVGHSLGAAVAVAAVEELVKRNRYAEYAGLILCSSFTETSRLAVHLKLGGFVPLLQPLTWSKRTRAWINDTTLADTWQTEHRLRQLVKASEVFRVSIIHARDDDEIPFEMSEILFHACLDEICRTGVLVERRTVTDFRDNIQEVRSGGRLLRMKSLNKGGRNMYLDRHAISFEAARILKMTGAIG